MAVYLPMVLSLFLAAALVRSSQQAWENVDREITTFRVDDRLSQLASYSEASTGVTRIVYSDEDVQARGWAVTRLVEDGFDTVEPVDITKDSSHIDAIPNSGRFDGTLGVVGGIAALGALKRAGFAPKASLGAMLFTSEEPTRFGLSCLGSRAMAGAITPENLASLQDANNSTLATLLPAAKLAPPAVAADGTALLASAQAHVAGARAFVELHIEQGKVLEAGGYDIGVVTAIAAPAAVHVAFTGPGGHAGGQLMLDRRDPGLAMAELMLAVEKLAKGSGSPDTVATTGRVRVLPNAVNSVPQSADVTIDLRDVSGARRDDVLATILETAKHLAEKRGVEVETYVVSQDPPATCDAGIVEAASQASAELRLSALGLVSRAYHDSLFMSQVCPTGMIFIPCRGGVSHTPEEFASVAHMEGGIKVLARTLASLAEGSFEPQKQNVEL